MRQEGRKNMSLPSYVKWAGEDIINTSIKNVLGKYSIPELSEGINLSSLSYDELCEFATFVSALAYKSELYNMFNSDVRSQMKESLNKEFDRRLEPEMLNLYNAFDKEFNKEKWNGEIRYQLLCLHYRKGTTEMSCLKNALWFMFKYNNKVITMNEETAKEVSRIFNHTLFWEFGKQPDQYKYDLEKISEKDFKKLNAQRQAEIDAQNEFVKHIFNKEYDKAFALIEHQTK